MAEDRLQSGLLIPPKQPMEIAFCKRSLGKEHRPRDPAAVLTQARGGAFPITALGKDLRLSKQ